MHGPRQAKACPTGRAITCKGWQQEAALRMLHNNLDPEVAENPDQLIVYGGTGRAARDWPSFHAIVRALESLENDETLLVQSGRPVGIFRTHADAPRVLIANANLVGHWSNWDEFNRLEKMGLTMYGQMTAGSWIYIGSQGIVQGTYETFAAVGRKHFGGPLAGKMVVSGGMGGMGGAQPLAATMNGACFLGVEVDPQRIERRLETGYCDRIAWNLDDALAMLREAQAQGNALSVGLVGNCADVLPELVRRGFVPDVLTDQTSAHDPLNGYVPNGMTLEAGARPSRTRSRRVPGAIAGSHGRACRGHAGSAEARRRDLRLRQQHPHAGQEGGRGACLRYSRLRARIHPASVLRGPRAISLGGPVGRPRRHLPHRPPRAGAFSA